MKTLKALRRQEKELIGSTKDKGLRFFERTTSMKYL